MPVLTTPDSPARNTRLQRKRTQCEDSDDEVIIIPEPKKPRKSRRVVQSDEEIWKKSDEEILADLRSRMLDPESETYNHFNISVAREINTAIDGDSERKQIDIIFTCKHDPLAHPPHRRPRTDTSTGNLQRGIKSCNKRRGISNTQTGSKQLDLHQVRSQYTFEKHRVLIALQCAASKRPFNMVKDTYFREQVELLRPGTRLPVPSTVSRDIQSLYHGVAKSVSQRLKDVPSAIHLQVDGWTGPIVMSFLGLVLSWQENGQIHEIILEFVKLTEAHDGRYLAEVTADCLRRFGISHKLLTICMDNASNCDTMATHLAEFIPSFQGLICRTRCMNHITNLVAKAFIALYCWAVKKRKVIRAGGNGRAGRNTVGGGFDMSRTVGDGDEVEVDETAELAADLQNQEDVEAAGSGQLGADPGKQAHDDMVVSAVVEKAKEWAREVGIHYDGASLKDALGILPKVAGLARRVHDSPALKCKWDGIVQAMDADNTLNGERSQLLRRVPTRWNSEHECLAAHIHFRHAVTALTALPGYNLRSYRLTEEQWILGEELVAALSVFDNISSLFSQKEVPLVCETVPLIEELEHKMLVIRNNELAPATSFSPILRMAAHAALTVIEKYYALTDDCEVYRIATILCPDRKLQFLEERGWKPEDLETAKQLLFNRFNNNYAPKQVASATLATDTQVNPSDSSRSKSQTTAPLGPATLSRVDTLKALLFECKVPATASSTGSAPSTPSQRASPSAASSGSINPIIKYLQDPPVPKDFIDSCGGYLKYWHSQLSVTPVAKMALDYLSAPASSVGAERAFSGGRLQINHLQHNMSSDTFRAQMALGSWAGSKLMPSLSELSGLIGRENSNK